MRESLLFFPNTTVRNKFQRRSKSIDANGFKGVNSKMRLDFTADSENERNCRAGLDPVPIKRKFQNIQ